MKTGGSNMSAWPTGLPGRSIVSLRYAGDHVVWDLICSPCSFISL